VKKFLHHVQVCSDLGTHVRIAFFTERETGQGLAINIDGPSIESIERADQGTIIVRHLEDGRGGFIPDTCIVQEDFLSVIDLLACALRRQPRA